MPIGTMIWKLASPYDAYVSHVLRLNDAIERVRYFADRMRGYEAGLESSVRIAPGGSAAAERLLRFRERIGQAAEEFSDEEFEGFLELLMGGAVADVEGDRARLESRLGQTSKGLEEYFAAVALELAVLERRGYNPNRADVARQLRENRVPSLTIAEYRKLLHDLGRRVGTTV
jgi:hypothetical protein